MNGLNGNPNLAATAPSTANNNALAPPFIQRLQKSLRRQFQTYLDKSVPHLIPRWVGLAVLFILYGIRTYYLQGFYIVTYGLGIFLLNLLIGFLSPIDENATDSGSSTSDGPLLPTGETDEFKPFIRRLPEFKFWYASTKAVLVAIGMTLFSIFDVPVFWPILLVYFIVLFILTMKRQIRHMIKHKYLPFNLGKKRYKSQGGGGALGGGGASKRMPASDIRSR